MVVLELVLALVFLLVNKNVPNRSQKQGKWGEVTKHGFVLDLWVGKKLPVICLDEKQRGFFSFFFSFPFFSHVIFPQNFGWQKSKEKSTISLLRYCCWLLWVLLFPES